MRRLGFLMPVVLMCALRCLISTPGVAAQTVSVRLVGGTSFNEGRVEVYYQSQWGTVCDDYWDLDDANVVCGMLGLPPATYAWSNAHFGQGSGPISLDDVSCYGNESNIADCKHRAWFSHNCGHSEDAGVTCGGDIMTTQSSVTVSVRLVGGTFSAEGRVEVYYQSQWGTVCDDYWDLDDANVVCRMLGLPPATHAWSNAQFGQGSGPIVLDDVNCYGNESNIADCEHRAWFFHNCGHGEDAGVTCGETMTTPSPESLSVRLVGGASSDEGRVEVYYQGQWGTVCDDGWDLDDANVVCRMLGLPPASHAWRNAHFGQGSGPIALDDVSCFGYELNIADCQHRAWFNHNCGHSEDAGVTCNGETTTSPSPEPVLVRLVGGASSDEGRVEVYYQGQWGTVCDDYWGLDDANVVCRMLGLPPATHAWSNARFSQGSGPIVLDDVSCNGNESNIADCEHRTWYSHNCDHNEDAGVTCGETMTTSSPVSIRLVGGVTSYEGRVEVYYQGQWGTVCDDSWDLDDANVVCRMLDLPPATHAWSNAHFGQGSGPIALDDVTCYGYEANIADCQHQAWFTHNCGHSEDAGVTCGETTTTPSPVSVRLFGGASSYEGRVEVYYQGQWGTVCDDGWDLDDGNVVCRMLGLPPATHAWSNAHFGQGSGPIILDDVNCNGYESNIADCQHRAWFSHNCGHSEDAGVTCGESMTTPSPVSVRLAGGWSSYEGRVEVYYQGQWGTVCDDGWDLDDANVVCRMLDLPPASHAWSNAHFGQGSGLIALDDVSCIGYESNIADCQHREWLSHNCGHGEDAGVTCGKSMTTPSPVSSSVSVSVRLVGGASSYEGRVEVYYQGQWGTVCDDEWDLDDGNVVCRMLGLPPATHAWSNAHFGQGSGPIALDDVSCYGYESSIADCQHRAWLSHNCGHGEDAGVTCGKSMTTPSPVSFSVSVSVRLVGGASSYEGRVEVYYQGQWGTVCDDEWDLDDGNVVCRMLGLPPATHAWSNAHFGQGSGPIILDDVNCFGYEYSIADCQHKSWFSNDCGHSEDAGVTCGEAITTPSPFSVRLVGGSSYEEGRVEVYYQGQWGTVCDDRWDLDDANVLCRMLNLPPATRAWSNAHFGQGSGPIVLDDVDCYGYEYNVSDCPHKGWLINDCSHSEDAGVTCGVAITSPSPDDLSILRLIGILPSQGTVQVWSNGDYRVLCSDGWDQNAAKVVCRQEGYPTNAVSVVYGSEYLGYYQAYSLSCHGDEHDLSQCATPIYSSATCRTAKVNCRAYQGLSTGAVTGISVVSAATVIFIVIIVVIALARDRRRKPSQTSNMNIPLETAVPPLATDPSFPGSIGISNPVYGETSLDTTRVLPNALQQPAPTNSIPPTV